MSFTLKIKREICKKSPKDRQTAVAELVGVICFGANIKGDSLIVKIENAFVAKRIFSLVKECFGITPIIKTSENKKKNMYFVEIARGEDALDVLAQLGMVKNSHEMKNFVTFNINDNMVFDEETKIALLRGAFLLAGSCASPEKGYHLEIATNRIKLCREIMKILESFDICAKQIQRASSYMVYIKDSEQISGFLGGIGATNAMAELQDAVIGKGIRNEINRISNCESANLDKSMNVGFKQAEDIEKIRRTIGLDFLESSLKEIALLRLENKSASLKELGEMMSKPLSKSGVNHKLKKLEEIASGIKGD